MHGSNGGFRREHYEQCSASAPNQTTPLNNVHNSAVVSGKLLPPAPEMSMPEGAVDE
jgi:hypothetical protein